MIWLRVAAGVAVIAVAIMAVGRLVGGSVRMSDLQVAVVDRGMVSAGIFATGKVVPEYQEIINSPINTRIVEVYRKSGDVVEKGTPLLRLDIQSAETEYRKGLDDEQMRTQRLRQLRINQNTRLTDMDMRIKVARMALNSKEMQLRNERYLDSIGSGTTDRVRQAELDFNTARLELEQLRKQYDNEQKAAEAEYRIQELDLNMFRKSLAEIKRTLDDAAIRSPRRAVLTFVKSDIGAKIGAGEQVAIVSDLSRYKVECSTAAGYSNRLAAGGKVLVRAEGKELDGTIAGVNPLAKNGTVDFIVNLGNPGDSILRSGLNVDVNVHTSMKPDVLRIANGDYYDKPGTYRLFVFDGANRIVRRDVRLGEASYDYVEVLGGLKPGDRVVVSDMENYKNRKEMKVTF